MKEKVICYNHEKDLFRKGDKIIVGVSGGKDSVCLLHVLNELREEYSLSLFVVHIHHGIRGDEADEDAEFVKKATEAMNLSCRIEYADVLKIAEENHISEEEAGRNERYRIMNRICDENAFDRIAVAHHQEDVAETALFHLLRGTGTKGLAGIPPKRERIIRPILFAGSEEIIKYIRDNRLEYRTDRTNGEETYTRNILRLSVFPLLEERINAKAKEHVAEAAERIALQNEYIEKVANNAYLSVVRTDEGEYSYDTGIFCELEKVIQTEIIRRILKNLIPHGKNPGQYHYHMLEHLTEKEVGKTVQLPAGVVARRTYKEIRYSVPDKEQAEERHLMIECVPFCEHIVQIGEKKKLVQMKIIIPGKPFPEIPKKDYTKWIDYDRIENSVFLRYPMEADYFVLDAEGRRKKLSRYFIDEKIPAERRNRQVLVTDGSHVIVILSEGRMSESYKVTETTERILEISIVEMGY